MKDLNVTLVSIFCFGFGRHFIPLILLVVVVNDFGFLVLWKEIFVWSSI